MTMPEPLVIAAVGGLIIGVVGSVAAGVATIIGALRKVESNTLLAVKDVTAKAEVIVGHVNSEKTAAEGRERTLTRENELLREIITDHKAAAALLAQAAATRSRVVSASSVAKPEDKSTLALIQESSEATAAATAESAASLKEIEAGQAEDRK